MFIGRLNVKSATCCLYFTFVYLSSSSFDLTLPPTNPLLSLYLFILSPSLPSTDGQKKLSFRSIESPKANVHEPLLYKKKKKALSSRLFNHKFIIKETISECLSLTPANKSVLNFQLSENLPCELKMDIWGKPPQ